MATDNSDSEPLMDMTNEILLPDNYFDALHGNILRRDNLAMKLGVLEYEYEMAKARYMQSINRNLQEESRLMNEFLKEQGVADLGNWVWVKGERRLVRRVGPNVLA